MLSVYLTLSFRYLRRRWFYALMIVASIASGVSLLVATRAINQTMSRAAQTAASPLAGAVDFIVSNGESTIDQAIAKELQFSGIATAWPRVFENVELPDFDNRQVLLVGIDVIGEQKDAAASPWQVEFSDETAKTWFEVTFFSGKPVVLGKSLDAALAGNRKLKVKSNGRLTPMVLTRAGTVDARGPAASLGGNVLIVDLATAADVLGLPRGKVHRIDLTLTPGADRDEVRAELLKRIGGRAEVRTPDEQNVAMQNVMAGMQVALLLCGIAALVVGLFLVYNALSVSVAERRHEIGILLAVGATRVQIRRLFAGEAALLGLAGSLLGIPLGIGFAYLALKPVRGVLQEIFFSVSASHVHVDAWLIAVALAAGVLTAVIAALVPAVQASREKPADAVRRIPQQATWRHRFLHIAATAAMLIIGVALVLLRGSLPMRFGMYAGLGLVVVAALLATPLLTALVARLLHPLIRRYAGLPWRLAADNLIRAPGRTGIVIAALAAGVALFMQTAGTIKSNRVAIRQWVDESIAADLVVTRGSPVSAGGQNKPMDPSLPLQFEKIAGIERALPIRFRKPLFRDTMVLMFVIDADDYYVVDNNRDIKTTGIDLYKKLADTRDGVIISDNFGVLHKVGIGDTISLSSPSGPVNLTVVGSMTDYSWNHGSLFLHRKDYRQHWDDDRVDAIDIYLEQDPDGWAIVAGICQTIGFTSGQTAGIVKSLQHQRRQTIQEAILKKHGAEHGLVVLTREQLQDHIDGIIQRLYGIAYGQQFVVLFVAALGVVTALLISVMQRRREMGLLRAIGGSRWHVVSCVIAEAALMGFIGSVIGFLVGVPLEWFGLDVVILEETGYYFPLVVPWLEALVIAIAALVVATVAGLGPSLYAVRQRIPEAIAME